MRDVISALRLDLVLMTEPTIEALLGGDLIGAEVRGGFHMPPGWPDDHDARFLRMRLDQMRLDPSSAPWLARASVLRETPDRAMADHIGFHGPPTDGSLELGYTIFEPYRRRGLALEAATAMMDWARLEHGIQQFVVSISPENAPSLALARRMGFLQVGEQWDEEDGLEHVLQLIRTT